MGSGALTGKLQGRWAMCHVENAFPSFLLVKALLSQVCWQLRRRVSGRQVQPQSSTLDTLPGARGEPRSPFRACLSELTGMQGFA